MKNEKVKIVMTRQNSENRMQMTESVRHHLGVILHSQLSFFILNFDF